MQGLFPRCLSLTVPRPSIPESISKTDPVLCTEAFPSSAAFDAINSALNSSDSERKDAISQGDAIFAFKLKNQAGKEAAWHIDLKSTGAVGRGEAPAGKKANVVLSMSDADFDKMVQGKSKAQNLFMQGKLKVKGNVMKGKSI